MGICFGKTSTYVPTTEHRQEFSTASPEASGHAGRPGNTTQSGGPLSGLHGRNRGRAASPTSPTSPTSPASPASREAAQLQFAVTKVLNDVRNHYYRPNLKSSNKMNLTKADDMERVIDAGAEILRLRVALVNDSDYNVIEHLMDAKAHNCEELARLATYLLQQDMGLPARLVQFGSLHGVAAVGIGEGELPHDMREWGPLAYICDPWTNIACRAKDYPDRFLAKMSKWDASSKLISFDARGHVSPMDDAWINTVLQGPKTAH